MITKAITKKTKGSLILLLLYLALVLWYTVFARPVGFHTPQLELFWSYKEWLAGNWNLGKEILGNIGMFIPFGFLLTAVLSSRKNKCVKVVISAILFSCLIEILQFELLRGLFEFDDIFNNTLGAVFGYLIYQVLHKLLPGKYVDSALLVFGTALVVCSILTGAHNSDVVRKTELQTNIPRNVCFQIDKVKLSADGLVFEGFAFYYDWILPDFQFMLQSTKTGKVIKPVVTYGLPRNDVNSYFRCSSDYSKTGFNATVSGIDSNEEYEVIAQWNRFVSLPTGIFITGTNIHYAKESEFVTPEVAGTDLEEVVNKGYLRVYRPDFACYVYQYKGNLYWIADQSFNFENDGTTYIQYQLWTTQIDRLPQKRLKNHWYWDNIGGYFEKHEVTNTMNCGRYRVCRRKLPEEYSITSIVTGYYKNGKWIWRSYFRPVYEL